MSARQPREPQMRDPEDIARRAIALCLTAGRAEGLELTVVAELVAHFGVTESLAPEERRFLYSPGDPDPEAARRFQWGYEACRTLLWVLGYVPELGPPDATGDARQTSRLITAAQSTDQLVEGARPRSQEEVPAEADRTRRLWEASSRAIQASGQPPQDVLYPVVYQRHHALQWVLNPHAAWHDVELDP